MTEKAISCNIHGRQDRQIDLWCAFPGRIADDALLREYRCLLTGEEREREEQMHFAKDRRRYLVTRALVRIVLSKYAPGVAPHEWAFTSNRYGKPEIANSAPQAANLTFNITHAGQLIVVGVARGIALGIDTENVRVRRAPLDIADYYFTADEVVSLRAQSEEIQQRRFFEYWTLKESYIKAHGMGLSIPLDRFGFRLTGENGIRLWIHPEQDDWAARWRFWQFWLDADHVASVCAERSDAGRTSLAVTTIVPWVSEQACNCRPSRTSDP